MKLRRRDLLVATLGVLAGHRGWAAEAWPARPVKIVAPGTGGVSDIRARWLSERLARSLGQPVYVENIAGAGGNVAAQAVARSAPDGYTLMLTHQGITSINPHLHARPGFDALKDFSYITRFGHGPLVLAVHAGAPVSSVGELVRMAKAKPGTLTFGSPGIGTPPHIASELFVRSAGINATHVPYKGGGALATAMLSGEITWMIEGPVAALPHVRSGRLRALAVTGRQRMPSLPDVSTIAEGALPGYEFAGWTGVAVPAGTPRPIVERLHAEIARIAESPEGREWFAAASTEAGILSPDAFSALIRDEHEKLGRVVREAGIRVE